jgi:transcriptional regulator with XRE-family HTH domain
MPVQSRALRQLPTSSAVAIRQLGAELAVARLRRGESLKLWAKRIGISVPTLMKLEAGDPGISIGIIASALWLLGRDSELGTLAAPEHDRGAIEMSVQEAVELGRQRASRAARRELAKRKPKAAS